MNITQEIVGLVLAVTGAVWGGYKWIEGRIIRVETKADKALSEVAAHREFVARHHVTNDALAGMESRITRNLGDIKRTIEKQNDRLDRVIDGKGGASDA